MPVSCARNSQQWLADVRLLVLTIVNSDTPQRHFPANLTPIRAVADAFSLPSHDLVRMTQRLLIGTNYANI